jgi:pimeloyl-ACP methyl ester carboxylesterase
MTDASIHVRRGYTECRFGQMHYLEGRPATSRDRIAPTLVLLHQNPSSSVEYDGLLRAMARDRRVIALDTPGYGMSDPPPRPLSIADYAASFADGIETMGLAEPGAVDVFGFHSGAYLAAELGLQRPDLIGRLVLSGAPMRSVEECAERLAAARATRGPTDKGAGILRTSAALWRYVVTDRDPAVPLERAVTHYAEKNKPLHKAWWVYEGVWSYPARTRFPLIAQPTLFAHPHDSLLEATREAARLVPGSAVVEFPELDRDFLDLGVDPLAAAMRQFLAPRTEGALKPFLETAS